MLTEEQKHELEEILRQISYRYNIVPGALYFKMRDGNLDAMRLSGHEKEDEINAIYNQMREIIFSPQLQWAVYVDAGGIFIPSNYCLDASENQYDLVYHYAAYQFIPDITFRYIVDYEFFEKIVGVIPFAEDNDPLSQIFTYNRILSTQWPQHVYVCPYVLYIKHHDLDFTSIFHGKDGIVAYCTSLRDLVLTVLYKADSYTRSLKNIWHTVDRKIKYDNKLMELFREDRIKACDINFIKNIIKEEIEKTNSLMEEYGIVRLVVPLD